MTDGDPKPTNVGGPPTPAFQAGQTIDEFTLVRELGRGGMGVVWEAEQDSLKRSVALKLLWRRGLEDPKWVQRFEREAQACGRLDHPGIVRIFASGEADGIHYMAHELVGEGFTLAGSLDELRNEPDLPDDYYRGAAALFAKIADALEHAHQKRVLHRDVKPSNILIAEDDEPRLSDFGLARVEGGLELSRTGEFMGTPFYMSPEQAAARRMGLDHRTDVFSLGATFYEALTLERPFSGETSQEVFHKILTVEPRDPCGLKDGVPADLGVICQKALEKDPDRRYRTMAELAEDLRRFLANKPIQARPPGVIVRIGKWGRRHPRLSTGVGVGALTALGTAALVGGLMKYSGMFSGAMPDAAGSSAGGLIGALVDHAQELFAEEAHGLFIAGEYGEALTAFNRIKPEYAATHADTILPELAVCLWHSGDREAARQVMAEARRLIAELPEADHAPLAAAALLIEGE